MVHRFPTALLVAAAWAWSGLALAQTEIDGPVGYVMEDLGYDCAHAAYAVALHLDLTGLSGAGGPAGLNAFVLTLRLDRADLLRDSVPGADTAAWTFAATDAALVSAGGAVTVVGVMGDTQAGARTYHVATLLFAVDPGSLTLTPDIAASSLGTRVVAGDGPAAAALVDPGPFTVFPVSHVCTTPGDTNGDGTVDTVDVDLMVAHVRGQTGTAAQDCNGDGVFSVADLFCVFNLVHPLQDAGYAQTSVFDVDGSGGPGNLYTDGAMTALFVGGVTDPVALTDGLIHPAGAGRTDPAAIRDYLTAVRPLLDIDANGQVTLYNDITMLWLYLGGVRGNALVDGLIGPGAARTSAQDVEAYLTTLRE